MAPGGLSNYWTGAVPRFHPRDFTEGERLHERYRWPVTYDDLAPYYERVEALLGVVGSRVAVPNLPAPTHVEHMDLPTDWQAIANHAARVDQGIVRVPLAEGGRGSFDRPAPPSIATTASSASWSAIRVSTSASERTPCAWSGTTAARPSTP